MESEICLVRTQFIDQWGAIYLLMAPGSQRRPGASKTRVLQFSHILNESEILQFQATTDKA